MLRNLITIHPEDDPTLVMTFAAEAIICISRWTEGEVEKTSVFIPQLDPTISIKVTDDYVDLMNQWERM